ncbi:MAG: response regulator [Methylorubrum rhodinum]|uniref:response regulator n=1 Tax=Methylorubrum rhodinum TaxID=29428 RepID=UPI003BAF870A
MITGQRPRAILIAEHDVLIRMVTADMLTDAGFETIEVQTSTEAIAALEHQGPVHVLITGRHIPGNGVVLAHIVHKRWPSVSIIVTTGAGADLERELPPRARLLRKPYDFGDLIRVVEANLQPPEESADNLVTAPLLPGGVPVHTGADMSSGIGAAAAPVSEPDKS